MLFWVGRCTNTKIGRVLALAFCKISAGIHAINLLNELHGISVSFGMRSKIGFGLNGIAAQGQNVIDS